VFDAREPNFLEWYLVSGTDPIRTVRANPWATWEVREAFGQAPNPLPTDRPGTLDELRIAHNVAVANSDLARASECRTRLVEQLDVGPATKMTDGTLLVGARYVPGVSPTLEVYFQAVGPAPDDDQFEISSAVWKKPWWSLIEADDKSRMVGYPLAIAPALWKAGFLYVSRTEIRKRPGNEYFAGFFTGPDKARPPGPLDGATKVPLLDLN
jgi:hypothetical protein